MFKRIWGEDPIKVKIRHGPKIIRERRPETLGRTPASTESTEHAERIGPYSLYTYEGLSSEN
jgi:stage III sporulation protein SpoIIIAA